MKLILALALLLAACGTSGNPLPLVSADDPEIPLTPDTGPPPGGMAGTVR